MNYSRIAEQRKLLGLSQEELAQKLKVSQKSISKYERGDRRPSYETLVAMSILFGVTVDYLLGNTDNVNEQEQSEPEYTTCKERRLLEIYREYCDKGFSSHLESELIKTFPELSEKENLSILEDKILSTFKYLNEDNQDILIGKAKELLKEQRYEDSVAAEKAAERKVSGK